MKTASRDTNGDAGAALTDVGQGPTWFRTTRTTMLGHLRFGFACQGIDVTGYSDSDIGQAVFQEAWSSHNLIARAFARLQAPHDSGARIADTPDSDERPPRQTIHPNGRQAERPPRRG
jgi:hypothetical protein